MTSQQMIWVRARLFAVNVLICGGAIAIAYFQWGEAVRGSGFGSGGYSQGLTGTVMLWLLMAGIPILIFAIGAHFALTWLLFRPGEIDSYKAWQVISDVSQDVEKTRSNKSPGGRKFED